MYEDVLWLIISGGLGVYLIFDGVSRGYYLMIQTARGRAKIAFDKGTTQKAVNEFAESLRQRRYTVIIEMPV